MYTPVILLTICSHQFTCICYSIISNSKDWLIKTIVLAYGYALVIFCVVLLYRSKLIVILLFSYFIYFKKILLYFYETNEIKNNVKCNLDEEKIECALDNRQFCFWQGKKVKCVFISDVGTRGIYCL